MTIDLKTKLPAIMKGTDFWADFMDVVSDELNNLKYEIDKKKYHLLINNYLEKQDVLDIAKSFGYNPILILNDSLEYAKREADSIFFKVINKSTANYYNYIFRLIPYLGKYYLVYYDDIKMIKAIDWSVVALDLDTHNLRNIYTNFESQKYYSDFMGEGMTLDSDPVRYLDEGTEGGIDWYLDEAGEVKPTKHIALEYIVNEMVGENGELMDYKYFWYLEDASDYGRKTTDIINVGCQLNMVSNESLFYNDYDNEGLGYTYPTIQTSFSVTPKFKQLEFLEPFQFDEAIDKSFDSEPSWEFDTETNTLVEPKIIDALFDKVLVGRGSKTLFSKDFADIQRYMTLYCSFDAFIGDTVLDMSDNNAVINVNGAYERVNGISGKAIEYNGVDVNVVVDTLNMTGVNRTISFWIKDFSLNVSSTLFHNDSYKIWIDYTGGVNTIKCTITGGSGDITLVSNEITNNEELFIIVTKNDDTKLAKLSLGRKGSSEIIEEDSFDITAIGSVSTNSDLYFGSSNVNSEWFTGIIDEVKIYYVVRSSDDLNYLFTEKIGSLQNIADLVYTFDIQSPNEYRNENNWRMLSVSIPANSVNEELVAISDGVTETYNKTANIFPLEPKYMKVLYTVGGLDYQVKDNGNGVLLGELGSGTVNHTTGEVIFNAYKDNIVKREVISETPITDIIYNTDNAGITIGSCVLRYILGGSYYAITDDGLGNFTDASLTSATVDYVTGELDITFNGSADDVMIDYVYRVTSIPDNGTNIILDYKTANSIDITEMGIFDNENNMIFYATFPKVNFNSVRNHLTFNVAIKDL